MTWPGRFPIVRSNMGGGVILTPDVILGTDLWKWHRVFPEDPALSLTGSNVSNWPCKANNGGFFQFLASRRPLYSATSFNGGPGVTGDGAAGVEADLLLATASSPILSGERPYIWIVAQRLSGGAATAVIGNIFNGASHRLSIASTNTNQWQFERRTTGNNVFTTFGTADNSRHLFETGYTAGGTDSHAIDGVAINSTATLALAAGISTMAIYSNDDSTFPSNCNIAEIVVSRADPTALQKTQMRDYFGSISYYGLTIA